jgi:23S rRNA G2445 N2-methylase RlmL
LSSSRSEAFFASAPRGLEGLLLREISALQGEEAAAVPGGVLFAGDWATCYRVNLWSRIASRVLWRIASFSYGNEQDVYAAVRSIDWPAYFEVGRTLRVNVTAQKSPLKSLEFATLRIKDAVCDRFRDRLGRRPDIDRAAPDVRVHAYLEGTDATLYLDTSGEPLFKRGWRQGAADAPLRENLAAGIIMLTGWKPGEPLLDPMCGGATLLVEAATMARGRAPGERRAFGFQKLKPFDAAFRQRHRPEGAERCTPQPGRSRRRALGAARAQRRPGAGGAGARRSDGGEPPIRGAHGQRRGAGALLPQAGRRAEATLRRLALLFLHRRFAPAQADPPRTLGPYATLERGTRVPPVRV